MRSKALKQEALQAAREAKKERGKYLLALIIMCYLHVHCWGNTCNLNINYYVKAEPGEFWFF